MTRGASRGRALGEAFRKHEVQVSRVVASPMCRCQDTGRLMAVGSVSRTSMALLPDTGSSTARVQELKELIAAWHGPGTLVLVTHALTVRPLTGFLPEQAETVVLKPAPGGGGTVVGRIPAPQAGIEETRMPRLTALDHVGLKVADMDRTLDFYQRLGLTLLRTSGPDAEGVRFRGDPGGEPGARTSSPGPGSAPQPATGLPASITSASRWRRPRSRTSSRTCAGPGSTSPAGP